MKVVIVILAVIAFIACLLLGLYAGGLTGQSSKPTPNLVTTVVKPTAEQHTLILIQADDLTLSNPKLIGIWLLLYYPNYPKLTLLLLYPGMGGMNDLKARSLEQKFSLSPDGTLGPDFKSALDSFGFKSNGYMVIDNYGVTQWIDWLGGISYNDQNGNLNGLSVINKLPPLGQDDKNTGVWLKQVSNGVCSKIGQITVDANWTTLLNVIAPDHFHTDLSLELLLGDWKQIKSQGSAITCEMDIPN